MMPENGVRMKLDLLPHIILIQKCLKTLMYDLKLWSSQKKIGFMFQDIEKKG